MPPAKMSNVRIGAADQCPVGLRAPRSEMAQERCVLRHEVSEVCFNVFTEEEIKKLSVVRIVSSISYDRLGNPIKG